MADDDREEKKEDGRYESKESNNRDNRGKKEPGIHNDHSFFSKFSNGQYRFSFWYFLGLILIISLISSYFTGETNQQSIEYNTFKEMVVSGEIQRVEIRKDRLLGYRLTRDEIVSRGGQSEVGAVYTTYRVDDPAFIPLLDEHNVEYYATPPQQPGILTSLLSWVFPFILMIALWQFLFTRMNRGGGQGVMSFNQNKAKIVAEGDTNTRFSDVAGADESKQELEEVVDFLKSPDKYTQVGGKIPKGVLLVGPPGTGKTLLARAVAGEAGVPFFRMSGADFVEMFVGVGAARVRDLFRQAREKSPCIIFIDEIDAIGRSRAGNMGGNDEREQTLNQLLVEMDGFDAKTGVLLIAATNRPELLDPALLRPGRFDRQVLVDKPDLEGRLAILKIHSRGVKMAEHVNLKTIAQSTAGLAGADLANIVNESALLAVRNGRKAVTQADLMEAIEKSIAGLERKGRLMNPEERKRVAYHETGHALTAYYTEGADQVIKISIVPRGMGSLGYTLQQPTEDRYLLSESELLKSLNILLGGRAAEEVIYGEISTGASNDISRASDLVRRMLTEFGMSRDFRNVTLPTGQTKTMLGTGFGGQREFSEQTQQYIDQETSRIVNEQYEKVLSMLKEKKETLSRITARLLELETIDGELFKELIAQSEST